MLIVFFLYKASIKITEDNNNKKNIMKGILSKILRNKRNTINKINMDGKK